MAGPAARRRGQRIADAAEQVLEVAGERGEALLQQPGRERLEVDSCVAHARQRVGRGVDPVLDDSGVDPPVVGERRQGSLRYRVHRAGRDESLHVQHVRVRSVLGAGRGPERALDPGPGLGEPLPAGPAEDLAGASVGDPGVGHRDRATQRGIHRQRRVYRGIDPRHEERGDARDPRDRFPLVEASLQASQIRLRALFVRCNGEQQREIDVDPGGDEALQGLDARHRRRDFDHAVRSIHQPCEPGGFVDRLLGVVLHSGGHLEGDEAVDAVALVVDRSQHVRGLLDVVHGQPHERVVGGWGPLVRDLADGIVVVAGARNRLREDGGVRRQAADPAPSHVAFQPPRCDEGTADEVQPDALAGPVQIMDGISHGRSPCIAAR